MSIRGVFRRSATKGIVAAAVTAGAGATVVATADAGVSAPLGPTAPSAAGAGGPPTEPVVDFALGRAEQLGWDHRYRAPARASRSAPRQPLRPRQVAMVLLGRRGWAGQFGCLDALWTRESNWRVTADNPASSAYGIPQALPGSKMASAGPDWRTNAATQISWGLGYIAARYASPCAALAHSRADGYY